MKNKLGLIHVYTGRGKGKTSASLGLSLRAAGHNLNVYIIQFLKGGDTGELFAIEKYLPNIKIAQFGKDALSEKQTNIHEFGKLTQKKGNGGIFKFRSDDEEKEPSRRALEHAFNIVNSNQYDVLILDEINYALSKKLISIKDILKLVEEKGENLELVFTGRNAPIEIINLADYVTDMHEIKHPFQQNIPAREGIDY